jgi:type II secretion system protein H
LNNSSNNKGFTLLEVMLVVLIIGIITSLAVYSLSPIGPSRQAKREAQGLMNALDYAQQQAILSHQPYGLVISNHGYQFYVYQGQGQWQPTKDQGFQQQTTLSQIKLIMPNSNLDGRPSIVLLPSKEPQIYTIAFSLEGYTWHLQSLPPKPLTLIATTYE